jgi:hypothetical protein
MIYRSNIKSELTNNFADSSPTLDELAKKWPKDGEKLNDPTYYPADEIALIPTADMSIKAGHFNAYADAVVALQHYFKENVGKSYSISPDGTVSACASTFIIGTEPVITIADTTTYQGASAVLAYAEVTSSISLTQQPSSSPWNWVYEGTIPAILGSAPWNARSFAIHCTIQLEPTGQVLGHLSGGAQDNSFLAYKYPKLWDNTPQLFTSITPVSGQPTKYRLYVRSINFGDVSDFWNMREESNWDFGRSFNNLEFTSDTADNPVVATYVEEPGCFKVEKYPLSDYPNSYLQNLWAPVASSNTLLMVSNWTGWTTNPRHKGGFLTHKADVGNLNKNVGINFWLHSMVDSTNLSVLSEETYGQQARDLVKNLWKAGAFLRLTQMDNPKEISGARTRPQYQGYFLRLQGIHPSSHTQAVSSFYSAHRKYWPTWSILKVRYEDFAHGTTSSSTSAETITYGDWWGSGDTLSEGLTSGGWYYCTNNSSEFQILASGSVSPNLLPIILNTPTNDTSGGVYIGGNNTVNYSEIRFEMIENTVYLYTKPVTSGVWTLMASALDASPFDLPSDPVKYSPAGIWAKPINSDGLPFGSSALPNINPTGLTLFSNIKTYSLPNQSLTNLGTINVRANLIFTKIAASNSVPAMTT